MVQQFGSVVLKVVCIRTFIIYRKGAGESLMTIECAWLCLKQLHSRVACWRMKTSRITFGTSLHVQKGQGVAQRVGSQ